MAKKNSFARYLQVSSGIVRTDRELQNLIYNLNKEASKIQGKTQQGLIRAVAKIHQETEKGAVITPVDLGNLRQSWFYVTANAKIIAGGSIGKTVSENTGSFKGKKAGEYAAQHSSMKAEKQAEAKALSAKNNGPFIIFGYSVNYALWVHEMMDATFKRPGSGPKWFETAIKNQTSNVLKILQETAKIP